jgi:nucleoside-diphosphate-sugar epimerase
MTRREAVLVAGGAGFLGRHVVARLLSQGRFVVILDNLASESPMPSADLSGLDLVSASVVDPPHFEQYDFTDVWHLATIGSPPRYLKDPIGTLLASSEGTRRMLDLAARDEAKFVYTSTSEVYGDPEVHPQPESYPGSVDITSPRSCYDEGKRFGETLVHAYRSEGRVPETRVARIFNTYGPGMNPQDGRLVTNLLTQGIGGEPLTVYGDGTQTRSLCYVDDLLDGLFLLASSDVTAPVNLGSPDERTVNEIVVEVQTLVGDTGVRYLPLPVSDPRQRRPDISRAKRLLGWEPLTPLTDGLDRTAAWMRTVLPQQPQRSSE